MYRRAFNSRVGSIRLYSTRTSTVWVMTDGGLESTLQAMTLGKQLSPNVTLKHVVASKKLQVFPVIIQKYLVNFKKNKNDQKLPWYLTDKQESHQDNSVPDYIITSGQDAVPASIHYTDLFKKAFSVYLGYPNIPFINFDQVVLPKYLANAKMAALGPLARQKNGIITPTPLLDPTLPVKIPSNDGYTSVIIGGHLPECKWYSEDGINLADTIKRMVTHLNDRVNVVFTERTPGIVKEKFTKRIETLPDPSTVTIWDSTKAENIQEKIDKYEEIIQNSKRVVVTADLDYASAHAVANR
ncbi:hypothetical protein K501DRAFT_261657 [Backusella circina FSU 941]|nr:hypothetical protein K501DRAFT_261657 [Backusella circina FSU 941]